MGDLCVKYVPSHLQIANVLTKPLARRDFSIFRCKLGVQCTSLSFTTLGMKNKKKIFKVGEKNLNSFEICFSNYKRGVRFTKRHWQKYQRDFICKLLVSLYFVAFLCIIGFPRFLSMCSR